MSVLTVFEVRPLTLSEGQPPRRALYAPSMADCPAGLCRSSDCRTAKMRGENEGGHGAPEPRKLGGKPCNGVVMPSKSVRFDPPRRPFQRSPVTLTQRDRDGKEQGSGVTICDLEGGVWLTVSEGRQLAS